MIRRYSTVFALTTAVVVYVVMFLLLGQSDLWLRLTASVVLAAGSAIGVQFMAGRTRGELEADAYEDDAKALVRKTNALLAQADGLARQLSDPGLRAAIGRSRRTVAELLGRVEEDQPTSLYSSASKFAGHAESLLSVVDAYVDIERHPAYYRDAPALLEQGAQAIRRFDEFAIESIQLVNQGDMADYQANLNTVAPPAIPKLELL